MTTKDYWNNRAVMREVRAEVQGVRIMGDVLSIYDEALETIRKEINDIYIKYSNKTGLDVAELTKILSGVDRNKFVKSIAINIKKRGLRLEDVFDKGYIQRLTRLEAIRQQIYWEIQGMAPEVLAVESQGFRKIIADSYKVARIDIRLQKGGSTTFADLGKGEIESILRSNWIGANYSVRTFGNIEDFAVKVRNIIGSGLATGISNEKMSRQIVERFDVAKYDAMRLIRTETNYFQNQSELQSYKDEGVEYYRYVAILDKRTSKVCNRLNGKIFRVDKAEVGVNYPPLHPNSYHKETEVYTENGFVLVKDVKVGESVLSLNPETRDLEWVKVINTFKHKEKELLSFKSRSLDLEVTKDHDLLIQKRWNARVGGKKLEMVKAIDLPPEARFYRSSEWKGSIGKINTFGMELGVFCQFMGWYLSEGSISRSRKGIKIAQEKESSVKKIEKMLKLSGLSYTQMKGGFLIKNNELREYLERFGKGYERYVPEEIKKLPKKYIRKFLDAYNLGDGGIRRGNWKNGRFVPEKTYFTSSKRMADDIGELLLKVGKRPSYYLQKGKGVSVKHKNGTYIGNWDIWIIRECNSQFANTFERSVVEYNDFVYCVELEKNHTLFVRKNGKCVWSGNCRSGTKVAFASEAMTEGVEGVFDFNEVYETSIQGLVNQGGWKRR